MVEGESRAMEWNSNLPVLVPAVIAFIVISTGAALALAWNRRPQIQLLIRRAWFVAAIVIVGSVAIFWISTAMVEGPKRATVSRSLQQQQQDDLHKRLQTGGH